MISTANGASPQPDEPCSNLTFEQNLTHPSRLWTFKLGTFKLASRDAAAALPVPRRRHGWVSGQKRVQAVPFPGSRRCNTDDHGDMAPGDGRNRGLSAFMI